MLSIIKDQSKKDKFIKKKIQVSKVLIQYYLWTKNCLFYIFNTNITTTCKITINTKKPATSTAIKRHFWLIANIKLTLLISALLFFSPLNIFLTLLLTDLALLTSLRSLSTFSKTWSADNSLFSWACIVVFLFNVVRSLIISSLIKKS